MFAFWSSNLDVNVLLSVKSFFSGFLTVDSTRMDIKEVTVDLMNWRIRYSSLG